MNIAVLGGSFDPVHNGHLLLAEEVRDILGLDYIYFIPTFMSPHKERKPFAGAEHRLNMLELAIGDSPYFRLSDIEIKRMGDSYTIDTVNALYKTLNIKGKIGLIIGADLMPKLQTWKNYKELIKKTYFIVANRGKIKANQYSKKSTFIQTVDNTTFSVSSSIIRTKIKENKSVQYLLPQTVEKYIKIHNIYN